MIRTYIVRYLACGPQAGRLAVAFKVACGSRGDPLENAIAERVNGIMKQEYLEHYMPKNKEEIRKLLADSVNAYNNLRPHMSCNMLTPETVHQNNLPVQRNWKSYYKPKTIDE